MPNIPKELEYLISGKRWAELMIYARYMWDQQAWLANKRNKNAVARIKQEFTRLTRKPPYYQGTNAKYWDEQIAKYVDRLGVKAIIDDMRIVIPKYKPRSIIYFLYTGDNKASRWEMLLRDKIAEEMKAQKDLDNEAYAAMAKVFGFELRRMESKPQWITDAEKRLKTLEQLKSNSLSSHVPPEVNREIARIKHNLKKYAQ